MPVACSQVAGKVSSGSLLHSPVRSSLLGPTFFSDRYPELLFSHLYHRLVKLRLQLGFIQLPLQTPHILWHLDQCLRPPTPALLSALMSLYPPVERCWLDPVLPAQLTQRDPTPEILLYYLFPAFFLSHFVSFHCKPILGQDSNPFRGHLWPDRAN